MVQHMHPAFTMIRSSIVRAKKNKKLEIFLDYDHETRKDLVWNIDGSGKDLR